MHFLNTRHKYYDGNPFFIKKGKVACLLVHGLTSSTQEMEDLGLYLSKNNFTVLAVLLKGHNTSIYDMDKSAYKDWIQSISEGYNFLKRKYKRIYLISLSTGATLSLLFSAYNRVSGIAALAPAIFFKDKKSAFIPILKYFKKYHKKDYSKYYPERKNPVFDIVDEKAFLKRKAYKYASLNSLESCLKLIKSVKNKLNKVETPLLLIHSINDHTISPYSSKFIYNNVASKIKKLIWLEKSGHIITVDLERSIVFKEIKNWIKEMEGLNK